MGQPAGPRPAGTSPPQRDGRWSCLRRVHLALSPSGSGPRRCERTHSQVATRHARHTPRSATAALGGHPPGQGWGTPCVLSRLPGRGGPWLAARGRTAFLHLGSRPPIRGTRDTQSHMARPRPSARPLPGRRGAGGGEQSFAGVRPVLAGEAVGPRGRPWTHAAAGSRAWPWGPRVAMPHACPASPHRSHRPGAARVRGVTCPAEERPAASREPAQGRRAGLCPSLPGV